jgi:thiamine kinase-like enzyme
MLLVWIAMTLRIQISDERERMVFTLTGRMQGEQIAELQALLKSELPTHHLVLDMKDVKLVDREAVRYLAEVESQGAVLRNCCGFIREWISRERDAIEQVKVEDSKLKF